MDSLLQTGHRPGVLRRERFLKENPQCKQEAGSIINFFEPADLEICSRWSSTSRSLMPNLREISRRSRDSSSRASAILFLGVSSPISMNK